MTTHKMKRIKGKMYAFCKPGKLYDFKENFKYNWKLVACDRCKRLGGK